MALQIPLAFRRPQVKPHELEPRAVEESSVDYNDMSWAGPQLRSQLLADPVAVLRDRGINVSEDAPGRIVHEFARVALLLWMDGKVVPVDQFRIDPADEGLLFGRGVWESTRTYDGTPWLWPLHLDRMLRTAELLRIELTPDRLPNAANVRDFVRALTSQDVVVRLNATAGRPGKSGVVWMTAAPLPHPAASMRLRTCRSPVQKGQAYLTLKTFQYATRLRIAQQATEAGFDTALLLDAEGNLLEAANANIFVRLSDGWATPAADGGLLPGTVRQHLLRQACVPIREMTIPRNRLKEVTEAFVTNSNFGIVPVTQIDGQVLQIGRETRTLANWLCPNPSTTTHYRYIDNRHTSS